MPVKTIAELKAYFQTGDRPTEAQFIDLFDSMYPPIPVSSGLQVMKVSKTFADWQPSTDHDNEITFVTLPAGAVPMNFKTKTSVAFESAVGDMTASIRFKMNGSYIETPECDLLSLDATAGSIGSFDLLSAQIPNHDASQVITVNLHVSDESGGTTVIDDLTGGVVDMWIWYVIGL